ncbi:MAG TPA: hypothetical protein VNG51_04995 [Ktedonobacteraceae bacterium]|nr:hypothetical protein [Ktedonobacteraceae bacterium]
MHFILDTGGSGDERYQVSLHPTSSATGVFSLHRKPTPSTTSAAPETSTTPVKHWYRLFLSPLWLYFMLAIVVRAWLVIHTNGVIDGDEALVGIQAEHILHGEWPIYFYGQPYMGSLEAYLAALLFAIFGASVWTLRAEPTLLSLVVIWLTWKLAGILADIAGLSPRMKHFFMTIAVLGAVVPPLYDTVVELRMLGGYIETFVLMLWLLLSVVQLLRRWTARATRRELALRWAGIGFIIGLGFWVDPLIVSAIFASFVWIGGYCLLTLSKEWRHPSSNGYYTLLSGLLLALAAIPAAIIGSAPAIYWGYYNHWANFAYVFARSGRSTLLSVSSMVPYYVACVAPHVIGGGLLNENAISTMLHILPLALNLFCCLATAVLVVVSLFRPHPLLLQIRRLAAFPLFFGFCTAIFFCIGNSPSDCQQDSIGRFAAPLMLVLPIFIATILTGCTLWLSEYRHGSGNEGRASVDREIRSGQAGQATSPPMDNASARRHSPMTVQVVLMLVLLATLFMQGWSYGLADAASTFQSPSCTIAPANNDAILAYLQQNHIHYAWAISWIGYPLDFKANGSIIIADPRPAITHPPTAGRLPYTTQLVLAADRPSMLAFVKHGDAHSVLLRLMRIEHITYRMAIFPSEPGYDVLVVTPLNRTVSIFSSHGFNEVFAPCY